MVDVQDAVQEQASEKRRDPSLFVRYSPPVMEALDHLVKIDRKRRGESNRSDVVRALILDAYRRARAEGEEVAS